MDKCKHGGVKSSNERWQFNRRRFPLCPDCGLCCNGVLFADVELRAGDDAGRLKQLA